MGVGTVRNKFRRLGFLVCLVTFVGSVVASSPVAADEPRVLTGNIDGADYKIEVPPNWNGTLLLFSHGAVRPGFPNPALDASPHGWCWWSGVSAG